MNPHDALRPRTSEPCCVSSRLVGLRAGAEGLDPPSAGGAMPLPQASCIGLRAYREGSGFAQRAQGLRSDVKHLIIAARGLQSLLRGPVAGVVNPELAAVALDHVLVRVEPHLEPSPRQVSGFGDGISGCSAAASTQVLRHMPWMCLGREGLRFPLPRVLTPGRGLH